MRPKLSRAELQPVEDGLMWKLIMSTNDDRADTVCYGKNKEHAMHVLCSYLEATGQRLPKKPNYDRPHKIIYYWR